MDQGQLFNDPKDLFTQAQTSGKRMTSSKACSDCSTCPAAADHQGRAVASKKRRKPKKVLSEWMVVKTKPNQERYAAKNVRRQGHVAFTPFIRDERDRESPLFPGHIFVKGPAWWYLKNTYGVVGPIMIGAEAAYVSLKEMKVLLAAAGEDDVIELYRPKLSKGMGVVISHGAFDGFIAQIVDLPKKDRVKVLFRMLGKEVSMELSSRDVRPT